jgi:5'-nucleotidase/UDP-sugar diphosphatase
MRPVRLASVALALLLAAPFAAPFAGAEFRSAALQQDSASAPPIHLVILHTNDVHGQALPRRATWIEDREVWVGGLERLAAYVASVRAEMDEPHEGVLLLDGGDWFQGTPEGRVRDGREFVKLLAALDYDAMAIGNHEFDLGLLPLLALLLETEVPSVCANLYDGDARVGWVRPYRTAQVCGLDVAFVGLLSPRTPDITHPEARRFGFLDPIAEFTKVTRELPEGIELVIPLTHNGLELDRDLAIARPDLPLIVGGHSHTYLRDGVIVGDTRIVQAGDKATVVGRVDLLLDPVTKKVKSSRSRLVELDAEPDPKLVPQAIKDGVARLAAATEKEMAVVVGRLAKDPVQPGPLSSGGLGSWISDAMRKFARADIGVHNRGGIRSQLVAGPITRRHLFEVCPFPNTVVSFELTGAELRQCLELALDGKETVRLEVSGLAIGLSLRDDGKIALESVQVNGEPLDRERTYRVATNSFLATGGDLIFRLERNLESLDTGVLVRDLLEQEFAGGGAVQLPEDDRFAVR